jgi:hypothetical protein
VTRQEFYIPHGLAVLSSRLSISFRFSLPACSETCFPSGGIQDGVVASCPGWRR